MPYRIVSNRTMILLSILIFCVTANAQHALLVGVSRYPALSEKFQLKGPPNDVALMKRLLIEKFDFPDNEDVIRILSEAEGIKNSSRLPTRENICREFTRLSKITQNGENVVVFMAGHGSQQPQNVEDEYPEQDGLDQIFLPRDTGPWKDGLEGRGVQNCITDNEISKWLRQISAKGAHIWAIFDCCHSGDITRGVGETERYIPEGNDGLAIPESSIAKSNKKRGQSRLILDHGVMEVGRQDNLALLYACQRNEKAVERNLPFSNSDSHYGLLTYCLNSVLSRTEGDLSYQELGKRIHLEYINLGRTSGPTPLVEGADIARSVLGNDTIHRSLITVTLDARMRKLKVDAGQLQGITSNSILAVYPPPGEKRLEKGNQELKPIGYLSTSPAN